jgi:hypothetical protein
MNGKQVLDQTERGLYFIREDGKQTVFNIDENRYHDDLPVEIQVGSKACLKPSRLGFQG